MSYEIINTIQGKDVVIGDLAYIMASKLHDNVRLNRFNNIMYSEIGRYTYTGQNTSIMNAKIGKFCSISWNVSIGGNNHDLDKITTHSFLVYPKYNLGGNSNWKSVSEKCIVENDVWIGAGASILRGVIVGTGAVIGASSVVTKNVPPYAIVAGNPAKIIRMRVKEEYIQKLLELKWWDFPDEVIRNNYDLFNTELSDEVIRKMFEIKSKL